MLLDTTIIHFHSAIAVIGECQVVFWPDRSSVKIHRVQDHGADAMFLRAFRYQATQWIVFDLRHLARSFAGDMISLPERDANGLVLYTLRQVFSSSAAFVAEALQRPVDVSLDASCDLHQLEAA